MYRRFVKVFLDYFFSFLLLLLTVIPMLFIALLIKLDSEGPVLFCQPRIGKNGKVFRIFKFRSMYVDSENKGSGVYSRRDDPRVTRVGRILRITSLDELPQLLNVLRGEMSFIGPRPPLTYHPWKWEEYSEPQKQMFTVLPGITGWAQVNGRKVVEWNRRIEYSSWYAQNVSFGLDLRILWMTFAVVFSQKNVHNEAENTVHAEEKVAEMTTVE